MLLGVSRHIWRHPQETGGNPKIWEEKRQKLFPVLQLTFP
ncbi:hypothetical protein CORMATOL_02210 [Corynebacterium matruchotii ATCC 33806]|uniref:Uncharacterized protein n=1 Tax=Corynebacterium matruchotii ATCC 33806 TaxID=566549 RepID=C0E5D3_9CORY|nr:hypothetical protein CORMATOL_02210 [Corynebacterium matruchotii ATCC 33806]